jgi:hypothetical protein
VRFVKWSWAETRQEKLVFVGLALPFVLLNPVLLLLHGFIWTTSGGVSSALIVYLMKLTPLIFAVLAIVAVGAGGLQQILRSRLIVCLAGLLVLGAISPLFYEDRPSLFYWLADAAGLSALFCYALLTRQLLRSDLKIKEIIHRVIIAGAAATSIVICGLWVWSGGGKVSIPPDINYGIALTFVLYFSEKKEAFNPKVAPFVVAAGVAASMFRMNMILALAAGTAGLLWSLVYGGGRRRFWRLAEATLMIAFVVVLFHQTLGETISRLNLRNWNPLGAIEVVVSEQEDSSEGKAASDESISSERSNESERPIEQENSHEEEATPQAATNSNHPEMKVLVENSRAATDGIEQRYVEAVLVIEELQKHPASFLTGRGFGASFENVDNVLGGHGAREHSVHNSIFAILLRSGLIGVVIFLTLPVLALRSLFQFRWKFDIFVPTIALLAIYLACMTDQYVSWGGYLGIAAGVWLAMFEREERTEGALLLQDQRP